MSESQSDPFILASDYGLVNFVQKGTEISHGKASFTTRCTLGQNLLVDYINRATHTIRKRGAALDSAERLKG
jgi:uncharacterized protein with von Willebrand factor type A (vWA) domain